MDPHRGVRSTENRYLNDGMPNLAYVVERDTGLQIDLLTGGSISISKEVFKRIQGLKKGYCKFYCQHYKILCNQKEYTVWLHIVSR